MLEPKKIKFRKGHRGNRKGMAKGGMKKMARGGFLAPPARPMKKMKK